MTLALLLALANAPQPAPASSAPAVAAPAAPATAAAVITPTVEAGCGYLYIKPAARVVATKTRSRGKKGAAAQAAQAPASQATLEYRAVSDLHVMGGPLELKAPATTDQVFAWRCTRDTIVPADFDGRVILLFGKPLRLTDGARAGELNLGKQGFSYTPVRGAISDAEKASIQQRLNTFNARLVAAARAQSAARAQPAVPAPQAAAPAAVPAKPKP